MDMRDGHRAEFQVGDHAWYGKVINSGKYLYMDFERLKIIDRHFPSNSEALYTCEDDRKGNETIPEKSLFKTKKEVVKWCVVILCDVLSGIE